MALIIFSDTGPTEIVGGGASRLFDLAMPPGESTMHLRFIALFRDNQPLRGDASTFEIQASGGRFASVGPDSGKVDIPGRQDDSVAASVTCTRDSKDIYLLTISDIAENAGEAWHVRIRNHDPETLRFMGFASTIADETLQPWLVLPEGNFRKSNVDVGQELLTPQELASGGLANDVPFFHIEQSAQSTLRLLIRNWGTKRVTFSESLGPLGENPEFALEECPTHIDPQGARELKITSSGSNKDVVHLLRCDDRIKKHTRLGFDFLFNAGSHTGSHQHGSSGPGSLPEFFCRTGCGCQQYVPTPPNGQGLCGSCGHTKSKHMPI